MRNTVIIADDVELNRSILSDILSDEYRTLEADNGKDVITLLEQDPDSIAVVLLDLMMPVMNGVDVLTYLKQQGYTSTIPVLIISAETDIRIEEECLSNGATDFIKKPFHPSVVHRRIKNCVALYDYQSDLEKRVDMQTRQLRRQTLELQERNRELSEKNEQVLELLSDIVESRDETSGTHVKRVRYYTESLAEQLKESYPAYGLTEKDVGNISAASVLHDIGKIKIPDGILLKPGRLTSEEFELMKQHTIMGCQILEKKPVLWDPEYFKLCMQICRSHHEKWDGQGYPDGLAGNEIPISAQLVSIADCFDALTTVRPYKRAYSLDEAHQMICGGECGMFNPDLLACFIACRSKFRDIAEYVGE